VKAKERDDQVQSEDGGGGTRERNLILNAKVLSTREGIQRGSESQKERSAPGTVQKTTKWGVRKRTEKEVDAQTEELGIRG